MEKTIEVPFEELSRALIEAKLDFHYGDEMLMEDYGEVRGDKFVVGSHEYHTVVVPPAITLRENTVKLLTAFAQAGGRIVFLQQKPSEWKELLRS